MPGPGGWEYGRGVFDREGMYHHVNDTPKDDTSRLARSVPRVQTLRLSFAEVRELHKHMSNYEMDMVEITQEYVQIAYITLVREQIFGHHGWKCVDHTYQLIADIDKA